MTRRTQSGAAAVEFAFVFPVLFLLMYGVVVYAYTLILQEAITYAAQEAAEAAVSVNPRLVNADVLRTTQVRETVINILAWLPTGQKARVIGESGQKVQVLYCVAGSGGVCPPDTDGIIVTLLFDMAAPDNLFPVLDMPLIGQVPPLPAQLKATAVARV